MGEGLSELTGVQVTTVDELTLLLLFANAEVLQDDSVWKCKTRLKSLTAKYTNLTKGPPVVSSKLNGLIKQFKLCLISQER